MAESWDIIVVGAGPAAAATALGALSVRPGLRVLLLDRAAFPRDKACGDGIAPHVLDVLLGLLDDWTRLHRLDLSYRDSRVPRPNPHRLAVLARPGFVRAAPTRPGISRSTAALNLNRPATTGTAAKGLSPPLKSSAPHGAADPG